MGNGMVTWPTTSRDPGRSSRDPDMLKAQYLYKTRKLCYSKDDRAMRAI